MADLIYSNEDSLAPTAPTTTATSLTSITPTPSSPESRRRFIGDLNPESIFLTSGKFKTPVQRDITECGVWEESPPRTGDASTRSSPSPNHQSTPRRLPIHISPAYRAYLESIRAFDLPEKRTQDALIDIYLVEIHPVLPILNILEFQQAREKGTVSLPLLMAVMLAAVKHPDAVGVLPAGTNQRVMAATMAERINALLNGVNNHPVSSHHFPSPRTYNSALYV